MRDSGPPLSSPSGNCLGVSPIGCRRFLCLVKSLLYFVPYMFRRLRSKFALVSSASTFRISVHHDLGCLKRRYLIAWKFGVLPVVPRTCRHGAAQRTSELSSRSRSSAMPDRMNYKNMNKPKTPKPYGSKFEFALAFPS